jgi:hypothetical protein
VKAYGYIKDGVLKITNRRRFDADIKGMKDCEIELIIKKRGKRSLQSNRFYWGVLVDEIRREFKQRGIRMDAEQVHEFLKIHFNKKYVHDEHGEVLAEYGGSTAEMNPSEFTAYIDAIVEWCSEKLELVIPEAGQQAEMKF